MNRKNTITLILFLFVIVFISGCNSKSNQLICKINNAGINDTIIINFNSDNTEIKELKKELVMEFSEDITDEQINITMNSIKEECIDNEYINCEVKKDKNDLIYTYESSNYKNGLIDKTDIETIKEDIEKDGYSCKY